MNFLKPFGSFEIIIILCFITLYSIYFVRLVKINKKIKVNKSKAFYKFSLRSTYLSLMIIALLGPSFGENKEEIDLVGKDIMILVDLSESMNANDVKPSRLEKVKFEMKKVILVDVAERPGQSSSFC